jgi:subtilisin family serine protease
MENVRSRWRLRLGLAGALIAGATAVTVLPAASSSAAPGPCGPLGKLVEYDVNDRCDFGTNLDPMTIGNRAVVRALRNTRLFVTMLPCRNGRAVPVVAAADQLLVTAGDPNRLAVALATVRRRLPDQVVGEPAQINALAARLFLRPGTLTQRFMRLTVPTLQGRGFSVDLNYLEPVQPNNHFRPDDNPVESRGASLSRGGQTSVLVVDSPAQNDAYPREPDVVLGTYGPTVPTYDVDGNGLVDEDHSHGVFVASLVKRLAPQATVVLAGVRGRQVRGVARWSPMLFTDADVIKAMSDAFGLSPGGTAVRRGFDVVNLSLGGAGCDGVAARLPLGRFMRDLFILSARSTRVATLYVAAAGNDGANVKHFPAAWRAKPTIERAAKRIDAALGGGAPTPAGNEIRQIQTVLRARMIAVGSWSAGVRDSFSNCGGWVNGIADGSDAISRYPSKSTWASWSGTSFATPRVSAVAALGTNPGDVSVGDGIGAC